MYTNYLKSLEGRSETKIVLFKLRVIKHNYVPNLKYVLVNTADIIKIFFIIISKEVSY